MLLCNRPCYRATDHVLVLQIIFSVIDHISVTDHDTVLQIMLQCYRSCHRVCSVSHTCLHGAGVDGDNGEEKRADDVDDRQPNPHLKHTTAQSTPETYNSPIYT